MASEQQASEAKLAADLPLHEQLSSVSDISRTRDTLNAIETSNAESWQGTEAQSLAAFPREKALTFALVPARERFQYSEGNGIGDSRHLDECLRGTKPYTGPHLSDGTIPAPRDESDIEYASDEDVRIMERHWSVDQGNDIAQFAGKNPPPLRYSFLLSSAQNGRQDQVPLDAVSCKFSHQSHAYSSRSCTLSCGQDYPERMYAH